MDYTRTINLPQTKFSMKADLVKREPERLKKWEKENIYGRLRSRKGEKYVLHDGPPYANGDVHVGTALNKILKDMVVKYKTMRGFDAPFVPGWDCHGTPIEHQLLKSMNVDVSKIDLPDFRKKCRQYADKFIGIQRQQFKRLGVFGNWEHPYVTMDYEYEAEIVGAFSSLLQSGYIYRGLKPVHWCPSCRTALAEAEVEYEDHKSASIYVKFRVKKEFLGKMKVEGSLPVFFLIWTTTPWTLPANVAIAVHPDFTYAFVETDGEVLIMAEELVSRALEEKKYRILRKVAGKELENIECAHPFLDDRTSRLILAEYVTVEDGTGCVHIAPGHGEEDYLSGLKYNLPVLVPVNEKGEFTEEFKPMQGKFVFDADPDIVELLKKKKALLKSGEASHSYPFCWRCHKPIIFRAARQWFLKVDANNLREKVLEIVRNLTWIPLTGLNRISDMIKNRPDWCLSRQRFWGIPIPVVYCRKCGDYIKSPEFFANVQKLVMESGSDIWFSAPVEKFLPEGFSCKCGGRDFEKEKDILDVWFDSSVSHLAVLEKNPELSWPCDLYLEGSDQHRGWFQVSLITGTAIRGAAPFRSVLTHGFTVDGEGKKMSKSIGNLITAADACSKYGGDLVRLWAASENYQNDVRFSDEIMSRLTDAYRRIRNTCRFLLGNLYDFKPDMAVPYEKMDEIDRWALMKMNELVEKSTEAYDKFEFFSFYQYLHNFCSVDMSAFYFDVLKDRLYTFKAGHPLRRSSQTALYEIVNVLARLMAPALSFTAEEVWENIQGSKDSVHLAEWPKPNPKYKDETLMRNWENLLKLRSDVLTGLELARAGENVFIGKSLEAKVVLEADSDAGVKWLEKYQKDLPTLFIVSQVEIQPQGKGEPAGRFRFSCREAAELEGVGRIKSWVVNADGAKCVRCWSYSTAVGKSKNHPEICERCEGNL